MATPGALEVLDRQQIINILSRHKRGDWGDLSQEDKEANNLAIMYESRIFSSYYISKDTKIWVITEADRSYTTLLLPDDY